MKKLSRSDAFSQSTILFGDPMIHPALLKQFILFQPLTLTQLTLIANHMQRFSFGKNKLLFSDGEKAERMFFIIEGRVKVFKISPDGKIQILRIFQSSESFAEVPMFQGKTYPASAQTIEKTELLTIARQELLEILKQEPDIALKMISTLSLRLKELVNLVNTVTLQSSQARLANYLCDMNEKNNGVQKFKLNASKTDLANLLNMTRENLSRTFSEFTHQGLIQMDGKMVCIIDTKELKKIQER